VKRTAYIGLGGNVGNRAATLLDALKRIDALPGIRVRRISNFVETEPVGGPPAQARFLNAAAAVETTLEPADLLAALQGVEAALGRDRDREQRWGPRTCDLDILLIDDVVLETEALTVPHPRLAERLFVLRPLAEIASQVVHPGRGVTVAELLIDAEVSK